MKFNKNILTIFLGLAFILSLNLTAEAQKKRTTTKRKRTNVAKTTNAANSFEIRTNAAKVSTQIKNVTKFIYILGGIARGIEDIDAGARTGKATRAIVEKNNRFKQDVIASIRNLRAGLAALEVEFRTKPALKNYLFQLQGIMELSGQAEDLAVAGRFTDSGKSLLLVVEKLSDTLAAMP
jgi:hypothetical protein